MFEGKYIKLIALDKTHMATVSRWYNDRSYLFLAETQMPYPHSISSLEEQLLSPRSNTIFFAIVLKEDNTLIGLGGLKNIDWKNRAASFSLWIGEEEYRHQGYGRDAAEVLLKLAFEELNLNRVYGEVLEYNNRMLQALEKYGAVREGLKRQAVYKNGRYHNLICFSLLKQEWLEKQQQAIQLEAPNIESQAPAQLRTEELVNQLLHGAEMEMRCAAAEALGKQRDFCAAAIEALIKALDDESEWVRWRAAQSLGEIGDKKAAEPLLNTLYDSNWRVRLAAVRSLGKLSDTKALSRLKKLTDAAYEPDEEIRKAAQEAVEYITKPGERGGIQ